MKKAYNVIFVALCIIVLLSFLPWLYTIVFPSENSDPFVAFSPINDSFVVSQSGGEDLNIYTVDGTGRIVETGMTKNDRDSLIPQMYYNQLNARNALPDTINGKAIDVPMLKNSQWVFNSLPRDINRISPDVYPIMESRPKRLDLEDPVEVFVADDDGVKFIEMANNVINDKRSARFSQVFNNRGFKFPIIHANANVTAKKPYDEGYLLADADGQVFHLKMQAGQPYMAKINMHEGEAAQNVFILENPDMQHIGLVVTKDNNLYIIERQGYKAIKLPIEGVDASRQRITIFKNLFNWVIKISDNDGSRWIAIDSDDYSLLGEYKLDRIDTPTDNVSLLIFPFKLNYTDINDCYAYPRINDFSIISLAIWLIVTFAVCAYMYKHKSSKTYNN